MKEYTDEFLREVHLPSVTCVIAELDAAFEWDKSPQGFAAWQNVYKSLMEIAEEKEKWIKRQKKND